MIKVCGANHFYQLFGKSSIHKDDVNESPANLEYDPLSIISYSSFIDHTVLITKDGKAHGIGNNIDGQISVSLPFQIFDHFTNIEIKDQRGILYTPISALCSYAYTFYLVTNPEISNQNYLCRSPGSLEMNYPLFLNIGSFNPIGIFGSHHIAAIDSNGSFIIFLFGENNPLGIYNLPNSSKAISITFTYDYVFALSTDGNIYTSKCLSDDQLNFMKVNELNDHKIVQISSSSNHVFAVSSDGKCFCYGENESGQLGIGKNYNYVTKFTLIPSLRKYNIVAAYADDICLFQTNEGKLLSCGLVNRHGSILMNKVEKKQEICYLPTETEFNADVKFCVHGLGESAFFINCDPKNNPNRNITLTSC